MDKNKALQRRAELASNLVNGDRLKISWASSELGRISLKFAVSPTSEGPVEYYELNHVGLRKANGFFPARRYIFTGDGNLIGVVSSELKPALAGGIKNFEEVEGAIKFQIENGLWHPDDGVDDSMLNLLLISAVANPSLTERLQDDETD